MLRKTLFLDLDDTLVKTVAFSCLPSSAETEKPVPDYSICVPKGTTDELEHRLVFKRKGLNKFLKFAAKNFELCIFSAASLGYVTEILAELDPEGKMFAHVFTREHCERIETKERTLLMKNLSLIEGRDPENMILVDNCSM